MTLSYIWERFWKKIPGTIIGAVYGIGKQVLIKPGITIGNGAIVGMGSVVTHDVSAYGMLAGNPVELNRFRLPTEVAKQLEESC